MFCISLKSNYFFSSRRAWQFWFWLWVSRLLGASRKVKSKVNTKLSMYIKSIYYTYIYIYISVLYLPSPNDAHWHPDVHLYIRIL